MIRQITISSRFNQPSRIQVTTRPIQSWNSVWTRPFEAGSQPPGFRTDQLFKLQDILSFLMSNWMSRTPSQWLFEAMDHLWEMIHRRPWELTGTSFNSQDASGCVSMVGSSFFQSRPLMTQTNAPVHSSHFFFFYIFVVVVRAEEEAFPGDCLSRFRLFSDRNFGPSVGGTQPSGTDESDKSGALATASGCVYKYLECLASNTHLRHSVTKKPDEIQ